MGVNRFSGAKFPSVGKSGGGAADVPWAVFPSADPDPHRNYVDIVVEENPIGFVDNVVSLQNKSHGPWSGHEAWGNAAFNFKDLAGVERGAMGYSRNSAIQPDGYWPDLMYIEVGNPFTTDANASRFGIAATLKAGGPYWGGAEQHYIAMLYDPTTGGFQFDLNNGTAPFLIKNGVFSLGVPGISLGRQEIALSSVKTRWREMKFTNAFGITVNLVDMAPPYTKDDPSQPAWMFVLGGPGGLNTDTLSIYRAGPGETVPTPLFRLDGNGNLSIKGSLTQNATIPL